MQCNENNKKLDSNQCNAMKTTKNLIAIDICNFAVAVLKLLFFPFPFAKITMLMMMHPHVSCVSCRAVNPLAPLPEARPTCDGSRRVSQNTSFSDQYTWKEKE